MMENVQPIEEYIPKQISSHLWRLLFSSSWIAFWGYNIHSKNLKLIYITNRYFHLS